MFVGPLIGGIMLNYGYNIFIGAAVCIIISLVVILQYFAHKE